MEKRHLCSDITGFMAKVPKIKGRLTRETWTESNAVCHGSERKETHGKSCAVTLRSVGWWAARERGPEDSRVGPNRSELGSSAKPVGLDASQCCCAFGGYICM